jgi:thioredoxin reductase (NADPH)
MSSLLMQLETIVPTLLAVLLTLLFVRGYIKRRRAEEQQAKIAAEQGALYSHGPQAQHPQIDESQCIGCGSCISVCPEGDVLGMLGGKASIVKGYKCIGHGLCADACPVGAIKMTMANPKVNAQLPRLTPEYETTLPNLFVIGELGGLALIKNAVNQGRDVIDVIARRLDGASAASGVHDVVIVGAGPAGISASLRAIENKLDYLTIEESEIGGTVARYPRQKMVMTSPVEFPIYGKFKKMELSKEELLDLWSKVMQRADFKARIGEKVTGVTRNADGHYVVATSKAAYAAKAVILALGKSGTPRKLGVKGEELPKLMYRLIEADHYRNKEVLVVGGGDSAVEAAMGLGLNGNNVTLSYRQAGFSRIKERNAQRIAECMRTGKVKVLFNSQVLEVKPGTVVLECEGVTQEIPNQYVWVFAGGTPPYEFLRQMGVGFGDDPSEPKTASLAVLAG